MPIVSRTKLVNISHIVSVWPCTIALCVPGELVDKTDNSCARLESLQDKESGCLPRLDFILTKSNSSPIQKKLSLGSRHLWFKQTASLRFFNASRKKLITGYASLPGRCDPVPV